MNVHCSTVYNSKELEPTQMPTDDRQQRKCGIYTYNTIEYHAAIKTNEFVSFLGTWMKLETIILNKLT